MKSVTLFTSNVMNWSNVQKNRFSSTLEEVLECLGLVIKCYKSCQNLENKEKEEVEIICEKHRDYIDVHLDNDIRVTVKIFLYSCNEEDIREAFESISKVVVVSSFTTVILSIPNNTKISNVLPIWQYLEEKVNKNKIWRLGVTDMSLHQLQILCARATVCPTINQLHCKQLCGVPQDLKTFANDHHIELLSHSDNLQTLTEGRLNEFMNSHFSEASWKPSWIIKYSTIFGNRSVIRSMGYMMKAKTVQ